MPKRTPKAEVTDAELSILEVLWRRPHATIRDLVEDLYPEGGASAHATVQKLLERLDAKGCVERDRSGAAHRFRALVDREGLIAYSLREVADKLCGGSLTPLLTQLVRGRRLSAKERAELGRLVEELDRKEEKP